MIFEITVQDYASEIRPQVCCVKAVDWFEALGEALPKMGVAMDVTETEILFLEDQCSAMIDDTDSARQVLVLALEECCLKDGWC